MRTPKEKFDDMQQAYDNAGPPEDVFDAKKEAFQNEVEWIENDTLSSVDKLRYSVMQFLAYGLKEGWPSEYPNVEEAFDTLIEAAVNRTRQNMAAPFNQICDAAANWEAKRLATEIFEDK